MGDGMKKDSGQIVLITLLVLTIATTVALSLIGRTTTDTSITSNIEDSSRAFSAAEAGIEQALKLGVGTNGPQVLTSGDSAVTYDVSVATIGGAAGLYEFPKKTLEGTTETVWLANHAATGLIVESAVYRGSSIAVCWSTESTVPALVATILYKESSDNSYRVIKQAFDPSPVRAANNQFISTYVAGGCGAGTGTDYRETLDFSALNPSLDPTPANPTPDILIALRVRPVYSDAKIVIDSSGTILPQQGNRIESTGSMTSGVNRKIIVFQQYRSPSTIFDAALYSQGSITH
jgi:Tfp pilus assembly protein PilX